MKKILVLFVFFAVSSLYAFDLDKTLDKVDKAVEKPNDTAKEVGNVAADSALQELTKQLKGLQNKYGPIVFKTGKADVDVKKCKRTLQAIHDTVEKYPGLLVQIEGHTDNKGNAAKNMELSQKRAEAVVAWLINTAKAPAERLRAKGFGDTQPIANNKKEKGRAQNRRVDFSVSKM